MNKLNWGILGLGQIANEFAETFNVVECSPLCCGFTKR